VAHGPGCLTRSPEELTSGRRAGSAAKPLTSAINSLEFPHDVSLSVSELIQAGRQAGTGRGGVRYSGVVPDDVRANSSLWRSSLAIYLADVQLSGFNLSIGPSLALHCMHANSPDMLWYAGVTFILSARPADRARVRTTHVLPPMGRACTHDCSSSAPAAHAPAHGPASLVLSFIFGSVTVVQAVRSHISMS
jgi:hypothetical protein